MTDQEETITVTVGQLFVVPVAANSGTGYRWNVVNASMGLDMVKRDFQGSGIGSDGRPTMFGAGGETNFSFRASAPGKYDIRLEYARPWENKPPADYLTVHVTVI